MCYRNAGSIICVTEIVIIVLMSMAKGEDGCPENIFLPCISQLRLQRVPFDKNVLNVVFNITTRAKLRHTCRAYTDALPCFRDRIAQCGDTKQRRMLDDVQNMVSFFCSKGSRERQKEFINHSVCIGDILQKPPLSNCYFDQHNMGKYIHACRRDCATKRQFLCLMKVWVTEQSLCTLIDVEGTCGVDAGAFYMDLQTTVFDHDYPIICSYDASDVAAAVAPTTQFTQQQTTWQIQTFRSKATPPMSTFQTFQSTAPKLTTTTRPYTTRSVPTTEPTSHWSDRSPLSRVTTRPPPERPPVRPIIIHLRPEPTTQTTSAWPEISNTPTPRQVFNKPVSHYEPINWFIPDSKPDKDSYHTGQNNYYFNDATKNITATPPLPFVSNQTTMTPPLMWPLPTLPTKGHPNYVHPAKQTTGKWPSTRLSNTLPQYIPLYPVPHWKQHAAVDGPNNSTPEPTLPPWIPLYYQGRPSSVDFIPTRKAPKTTINNRPSSHSRTLSPFIPYQYRTGTPPRVESTATPRLFNTFPTPFYMPQNDYAERPVTHSTETNQDLRSGRVGHISGQSGGHKPYQRSELPWYLRSSDRNQESPSARRFKQTQLTATSYRTNSWHQKATLTTPRPLWTLAPITRPRYTPIYLNRKSLPSTVKDRSRSTTARSWHTMAPTITVRAPKTLRPTPSPKIKSILHSSHMDSGRSKPKLKLWNLWKNADKLNFPGFPALSFLSGTILASHQSALGGPNSNTSTVTDSRQPDGSH